MGDVFSSSSSTTTTAATTTTTTTETELEYGKPWRKTPWGEEEQLEKSLREFKLNTPNIKHVRILVIGRVGSGKSSFINSVNSVFQKRITTEALVNKTSDSRTFTKLYKTYYIRNEQSVLPFVLTDTMGLESEGGIHQDDVVKAMEGCIKERYKFNPDSPVSDQVEGYRSNPSLQDQTYCLVYVLPADKISLTVNDKVTEKIKYIKNKANELEIPQVVIMTRADEVCPLVKEDIRKIYTSKKIKNKLEECSECTGIPVSHVFPVKSYHEEIDTQADIDVLILRALKHIVQVANDALTLKSKESINSE